MRKAALLSAALALTAQAAPPERFRAVAEKLLADGFAGRHAELDALFDETMRKLFTREKRRELFDGLKAEYGGMKSLGAARPQPSGMALIPVRFERGVLDMKLVLDGSGRVSGLFFVPHAAEIAVPERHETALFPPFKGRWLVFWGGDAAENNGGHLSQPNQRGAFDLFGVGPDGKTRRGESEGNEDFHAFGREILAPADGTVTDAVDGVRDNAPGSMNSYMALGNFVTLKHRDLEYSVLAHLKQGSVRVKPGQTVKRGQLLGLCGNSGNSSEPHLHYHLQNSPVIQDGTGIKVFFSGLKDAPYSPVKGDLLDAR